MEKIRFAGSVATVLAALFAGTSAQAQTPSANDTAQREDVVVTAQKREQVLVDVPQSVSVVSGETLERNQAFTFQDYAKLIPGLQISQSNPGEGRIVVRGLNTGGVAATVATYIDETPFGSSSGQVNAAILAGELDTFDVQRIELLRGPQGTLYGASSLGGVLKFVTAAPQTDMVEARARAGIESTAGGDPSYFGSALVNVPLSDKIAVRASGFYRKYGGFIDSVGTAGSDVAEDINDSRSYGGRVSALLKPSEALSVRLTAILQNLNSDAASVVESDPETLVPLNGRVQSQYVPEFTNIRYRVYNATLDLDLDVATLTSSTSYSTLKQALRDDTTVLYGTALGLYSDATGPAADVGLFQNTNNKRFTQELRLTSPEDDRFEWLIGAYYNWEKGAIEQRLDALDRGTLNPSPLVPQLFDGATRSKYEEYAAFANATLHFGPRFDLTVGGRYSRNDQQADQGGTGLLAPPTLDSESDEGVFTWSIAPKFKFSETGSVYARVAKGFRPGGPNIVPPGAPTDVKTYDSDSVVNYEIGLKTESADRTFSLDVAAFYIDWTDIQLFAQINDYGVNANGGKARSQGIEATATVRPTAGLRLSVNGAYTDAKLREDTDPVIGGRDGDRLPFSPKYAVSFNGDYDMQVGGNAAFVGGSVRYVGDQTGPFSPAALALTGDQYQVPDYTVVDLRAGIEFSRFSVEAYVRNLGNSRGKTSVVGEGNFPFGAVGTGMIRPRSIGIMFGAGF